MVVSFSIAYLINQGGDCVARKLSPKQEKFIDAYIELGNATEAAKKAGYKCKTEGAFGSMGTENLQKLDIFIKERLEEAKNSRIADIVEVMEFLTAVLRGEVTEVLLNPVTGEKEDVATNVRTRIDAAKEILKRYPNKLDAERQKLLLDKLRLEIENMKPDVDVDSRALIIDDVARAIEGESNG